ncbi:MAG: PIN domain-containing protein [Nanoarchaeota archaeon]
MAGTTTIFNVIEYPPAGDTCEVIYPEKHDYILAYQIAIYLREVGKPQQAIDVLIASMCVNRGFELLTKDSDFENIRIVQPSFMLKLVQ